MPRVVQTLENQTGHNPAARMELSSPKPLPSIKSPGACSTPDSSGTFSDARTIFKFVSDKNKNKENQFKSKLSYKGALLKTKHSAGGLVEAAADVQLKRPEGGHRQGGGGAVEPGQTRSWENQKMSANTFYGPSKSSSSLYWNSRITVKERSEKPNTANATKKELEDKINRCMKRNPQSPGYHDPDLSWHSVKTPPPNKFGPSAADLNLSNNTVVAEPPRSAEEFFDGSEMVSSSSGSTSPVPPPLKPLKIIQPHNIGFKNHGNTCYINACMQSMLGLETVVTDTMNAKEMLCIQGSNMGLLQSFSKLCMAYRTGNGGWADLELKEVKVVMETLDKQFVGNKMQDASEFLVRFLDEINEDVRRLLRGMGGDVPPQHSSFMFHNFLHEKEEVLVCAGCKEETRCKNSDMSMWCDTTSSNSLSRTRSMSLQSLFEQSFAKERRMRRCDDCGCEEATVTSELVRLPRVMIIFLKRYKYSNKDIASSGKISRHVHIPETLCVSSLVSDTVKLPDTSLPVLLSPLPTPDVHFPSTPVTSLRPALLEIPAKFKGLSEEELGLLGEDDQLEYMMYLSEREAFANDKQEEIIDDDLNAALEASMRDDTFSQIMTMAGETGQGEDCRTPSRKRNFGELTGGEEWHSDAGGDGQRDFAPITSVDHRSQEEPMTSYSKVVRGKSSNLSSDGLSMLRPTSKEQEEADLIRVLELSAQEASTQEFANQMEFDGDMDDIENNNNMEEMVMSTPGMPEHTYQLHSVVSHHGSSASAGHYVADVHRFDGGGWFRYDDTRVTKTDSASVRTGPNCSNGYILTYVYQPLWEKCEASSDQGH